MSQNKIQIPYLFWVCSIIMKNLRLEKSAFFNLAQVIQFFSLKLPDFQTPKDYLLSKINNSNGLMKEGLFPDSSVSSSFH